MPLGTIDELAKSRLSFITDSAELDASIASKKTEAFYLFQNCLNKDDTQVEVESEYSNKEKLFISAYVAYMVANIDLSKSQGAGANKIKRAKADVVEVEFQSSRESGERTKTGVIEDLRKEACSYGRDLNCCPAICDDLFSADGDETIPPLLFNETLNPE